MTTDAEVGRMWKAASFKRVVIVRGRVKIELDHIMEGVGGDYNPADPNDIAYLRFWLYRHPTPAHKEVEDARLIFVPMPDVEWEEVENASYCTRLTVTDPRKKLEWAVGFILDVVQEPIENGQSVKKICESLSWITADGLKMRVRRNNHER